MQLPTAAAHVRPHGQHVVQRGHVVDIALAQEDREVLGVAVGRRHEPEGQLCQLERRSIRCSIRAACQQRKACGNGWASVAFILAPWRLAECLAEILLRQPGDPAAIVHPFAVEALHDQDTLVPEGRHLGVRHGQAQRIDDSSAQPFVLHGVKHLHPAGVGNHPERQLEDMGAGRGPQRSAPLAVHLREGRFFLRTGQRYTEWRHVIAKKPMRVGWNRAQNLRDIRFCEQLALDAVPAVWRRANGQQLHSAYAVTADGFQQCEGIQRLGVEAPPDALSYAVVVRQQVVEVVRDHLALDLQRARNGQRQGQWPRLLGLGP